MFFFKCEQTYNCIIITWPIPTTIEEEKIKEEKRSRQTPQKFYFHTFFLLSFTGNGKNLLDSKIFPFIVWANARKIAF